MKKIINNLFARFGYAIEKRPKKRSARDFTIKVGKYELLMPGINPLIDTYTLYPKFNDDLRRIVKSIKQKYTALSVIDIGANVGDTIAIIKSVDASMHILAIEGDPATFSYLKNNILQFSAVIIENCYLSDQVEKVKVVINKKGWNSTLLKNQKDGQPVDLTTLDTLLSTKHNAFNEAKFVKIDTEGFDTIIIRGGLRFIETTKPIIYFEYNRENLNMIGENGIEIFSRFLAIGYEYILIYDDRNRFIMNLDKIDLQVIQNLHDYADGKNGLIYYYDFCLFHNVDKDLYETILIQEKEHRLSSKN